jgi:DNA-binding NarL/FixJ family response regulator
LNGIEATRRLIASRPRIRVLVVSMHKEPAYVREMLKAGGAVTSLKTRSIPSC